MGGQEVDWQLARAVGWPRRVLDAGGPVEACEVARTRGASVDTIPTGATSLGGRSFDLVVSANVNVVPRYLELIEDGGRAVVAGRDTAKALEALRRMGLEILHHRGPLAVARKPPERRKLTLTVGMISMNEAGAVGGVLDDIRKCAPDAETLLVDSSKDDTPQIAESKGARVVRQFPPRGYGPAMHRLLYEATTDVIVTMDCDSTYPTDRIAQLRELVEQGADLVNATRTRRRPKAMPLMNYIGNRLFAGAAHALHGLPTSDLHSGMRAYRTSMLRGIDIDPKGAALPVELYVVPARLGYRIVEVDIPYLERVGATTLHRFDSTVWTVKRLLRSGRQGVRVKGDRIRTL